ncbi:MAG: cytochrome c3 family protein [Candidatus Poribacteria bacterium]
MSKRWMAIILILIALILGGGLFALSAWNNGVRQPIDFPHDKHVDIGMDCVSCHTGAQDGQYAGIPLTKTCALCHIPERSSPATPPELTQYLKSGEEVPWQQVYRIRRHAYFSHRRHVKLGELECKECHGDIESKDTPLSRPAFATVGPKMMNYCVDCHRKEKVTTDCLSCHR